MTDSLIERAMKALAETSVDWTSDGRHGSHGERALQVQAIHAVLAAIETPSEAMLAAGHALTRDAGTESGCYEDIPGQPEDVWTAMCRAAAKDGA